MTAGSRRVLARLCAVCCLPLFVPIVPARAADPRLSLDVQADLGYASNPFYGSGGTGSGFVEAIVSPRLDLVSARDTVTLAGDARFRRFFQRYTGIDDSYDATIDLRHALNPAATFTAGAGFASSRNDLDDLGQITDGDNTVGGVGAVTGTDLSVLGVRSRRYRAHAGLSLALSPRTSLSLGVSALTSRYDDAVLRDYDSYAASANLSRRLSGRLTAGVYVAASRSRFDRQRAFDSTVISAGLTATLRASARVTIDGQLGVATIDRTGAAIAHGLVGSVRACRAGERDTLCLTASRDYLPTGLIGTRPQTALAGTYTRRLRQYDTLSAAVRWVTIGRGGGLGAETIGRDFVQGDAEYGHALSRRLALTATVFARKLYGDQRAVAADYGGSLGVKYRFGDLR